MLQSLVSDYNNTKHRTIKMKPNDVNEMNERELLNTVYKYDLHLKRNRKSKFKLGVLVSISIYLRKIIHQIGRLSCSKLIGFKIQTQSRIYWST